MIRPSRRIETLLAALGDDVTYRDAILGDLAEEFVIRVEEQGDAEAKRWYRRQALRTAPHLLRQWSWRLSAVDIARLAIFTMFANALVGVGQLGVRAAIVLYYGVGIDSLLMLDVAWRSLVSYDVLPVTAIMLASNSASCLCFGYLLSRVERRAPLAKCVVVALANSLPVVAAYFYAAGPSLSLWMRSAFAAITAAAMIAGGVIAAVRRGGRGPSLRSG